MAKKIFNLCSIKFLILQKVQEIFLKIFKYFFTFWIKYIFDEQQNLNTNFEKKWQIFKSFIFWRGMDKCDYDNSIFTIEIVEKEYDFLRINSFALYVNSFKGNYGNYSIVIKLSENDGRSNFYPTTVILSRSEIVDFGDLPLLKATYMKVNSVVLKEIKSNDC